MEDTSLTDFLDDGEGQPPDGEDQSPDGGGQLPDGEDQSPDCEGQSPDDPKASAAGKPEGDGTATAEETPEEDATAAETSPGAGRSDDTDAEPAVSTAAWTPTGGQCATCGESVDWRFRAEAGLVCPDCKPWD